MSLKGAMIDTDRVYLGRPQVLSSTVPSSVELDWDGLERQPSMKYASLQYAMNVSTNVVQDLLQRMSSHLQGRHKYLTVDIRWWPVLRPGQCCALMGWHTDVSVRDDAPGRPERHLMASWGGSSTQYLGQSCLAREIRQSLRSGPVDPWYLDPAQDDSILVYGRDHLHSARVVETHGPRLLIRMTENDIVSPKHHIGRPPLFDSKDAARGHCQFGIYNRSITRLNNIERTASNGSGLTAQ